MRNLFSGLFMLMLVTAISCNQSAPKVAQESAPATTDQITKPVAVVANKPIAGEADKTFSLSVPFESVALKQGEAKALLIGINRGENFREEVAVKVTGLPPGVTLEVANPVITSGSTGVTLKLKATGDAALGDFTAKVTGHAASSGADFSKDIKITVAQK